MSDRVQCRTMFNVKTELDTSDCLSARVQCLTGTGIGISTPMSRRAAAVVRSVDSSKTFRQKI